MKPQLMFTATVTAGLTIAAGLVVVGLAAAPDPVPQATAAQQAPPRAQVIPARQTPPAAPAGDRPTGPVDRASCGECHGDVKHHAVVHGPVAVDACDACHAVLSETEHTYELARPSAELCTFCHDVRIGDVQVVHEPLVGGDCTACHDPHGGPGRMLLKAESSPALCSQCHEDVAARGSVKHGPVAAGVCAACHTPHASEHPHLLRAEGRTLCLSCHAETSGQLAGLRVVHEPVESDCQECHDPHASNHEMMLHEEPQALCLGCHETIRHTVESATTQHAAVTTDRQCLNCHDAHASDHARMLRGNMMDLCFECHGQEIELEDGTTLGNIKQVIETGTSLHGPISQSNCAACHMIHGGSNFRMLTNEYPAEFYAPFEDESYALCFSCHDEELVYDARTTSLTDFRNGDLNLHFLHVNRERKGRTCRACHETHASIKEKHIRDAVPFGPGGWELPIRFEKVDNGGRCAPGCHVPYAYDRVEPVVYPPRQEPALWPDAPPAEPPGESP